MKSAPTVVFAPELKNHDVINSATRTIYGADFITNV